MLKSLTKLFCCCCRPRQQQQKSESTPPAVNKGTFSPLRGRRQVSHLRRCPSMSKQLDDRNRQLDRVVGGHQAGALLPTNDLIGMDD